MKKIGCFVLSICLLITSLHCFALSESTDVDPLLADYQSLLAAKKTIYEIESSVYKAALDFIAYNDYPSLLAARVACGKAIQDLKAFETPKMQMSDDQILYYLKKGVEVDGLEAEFVSLSYEVSDFLREAETLEAGLHSAVYQNSGIPQMVELVTSIVELLNSSILFDSYAAGYLLSPLAQNEQVQQFLRDAGVDAPDVFASGETEAGGQTDAVFRKNDSLEKAAESVSLYAQFLIESEAYSPDDPEKTYSADAGSDINIIKGMPAMIPSPDWTAEEREITGSSGADQNAFIIECRFSGVSMEAFAAYYDMLCSVYGEDLFPDENTAPEAGVSYASGDGAFRMHRVSDGTVTIQYDPQAVSLESAWYVQYCRQQ